MELIASKVPGLLDGLGTIQGAYKFDIEKFQNAKVADEAVRSAM